MVIFSFWPTFVLLQRSPPLAARKIKTSNQWKKHQEKSQVYQKSWSYAILFLRYMVRDGCNCYFSFWAFFCPFTHLAAQKIEISNKKTNKKTPRDIILHMCTKNYDKMMYASWDMLHDGQMDRKCDKQRWVHHLKKSIFWTECNSVWDEKQIIINQILLSKLWYIGPIYTIPKFIKGKIEKNNSSALHLKVRTRYFRQRYSIKSLELQ